MENEGLGSPDSFYKEKNCVLSNQLLQLNEMMDLMLKKRASYAKLQQELNQLYNPKYLQELLVIEDKNENGNEIKRYLNMIQELD